MSGHFAEHRIEIEVGKVGRALECSNDTDVEVVATLSPALSRGSKAQGPIASERWMANRRRVAGSCLM